MRFNFGGQTYHKVYNMDNMEILPRIEDNSIDLVYTDPPFNTGRKQSIHDKSYEDSFGSTENFIEFLKPRIDQVKRILNGTGSLFFHIDQHESHYCKVMLDELFGRNNFMNEIVWVYDFGGRPKSKWPRKHDVIFWYAMNPDDYTFNIDKCDRIPYMAPGLVGEEKADKGKLPTDVWWSTIVPTNSDERKGYPTQKPLSIIDRIVNVHSNPGDYVLDLFAGSGTLGESAAKLGRNSILIEINKDAIPVIKDRINNYMGLNLEVID